MSHGFWTDERIETLRRLAADKWSCSEIAAEIGDGVTRNGIIGAAHRNGVHLDSRSSHNTSYLPRRPKAPRNPPMPDRRAPLDFYRLHRTPPAAPTPAPPSAPSNPCSLLDLTNETCRWPISDDGAPFLFCGSPEADLSERIVYCRAHAMIAYRRPGQAA